MARILLLNPCSGADPGEAATRAMVRMAARAAPRHEFITADVPSGARGVAGAAGAEPGGAAVVAMLAATLGAGEPFDGFIVVAFADSGLDTARRRFALPACGIGEASFHEAAAGGRRFAIATTAPLLDPAIAARVTACGHEAQFVGNFFAPGYAGGEATRGEPAWSVLEHAISQAIEAGAEAVIIGSVLTDAATALQGRFQVPLIEPVPAAARMMASLLQRV